MTCLTPQIIIIKYEIIIFNPIVYDRSNKFIMVLMLFCMTTMNQHPSAHRERWMISGQETIFLVGFQFLR
jgi:hypothetical protein